MYNIRVRGRLLRNTDALVIIYVLLVLDFLKLTFFKNLHEKKVIKYNNVYKQYLANLYKVETHCKKITINFNKYLLNSTN